MRRIILLTYSQIFAPSRAKKGILIAHLVRVLRRAGAPSALIHYRRWYRTETHNYLTKPSVI